MSVKILRGDCRDLLQTIPDESIDCILTDPPYGDTSLIWDKRVKGWPSLVRRVLKPTGSMWVFGSLRMLMGSAADFLGWKLSQDVIWEKHNGTGLFKDRFRRVHEIAAHFYRDDVKWSDVFKAPQFTNDATARTVHRRGRPAHWIGATGDSIYQSQDGGPRLQRSVLYGRSEHRQGTGHPTAKPIVIVEALLRYACPLGGHVLDPFAGSGSTAIAARLIGQDCTLIEDDPEYASVIEKRLAEDAPLLEPPIPATETSRKSP